MQIHFSLLIFGKFELQIACKIYIQCNLAALKFQNRVNFNCEVNSDDDSSKQNNQVSLVVFGGRRSESLAAKFCCLC